MGSSLLVDPATSAVFVLSVVTAPLCTLAAVLRFVAARKIGRRHSSEDWCAYGAVAVLLAYVSSVITAIVFLDSRPLLTLTHDELLYIGRLAYAVPPLFALNQLLTKLSVLLFYHRTFGVHRAYRIGIYVSGAVVVAWFFAVWPVFLFNCRPISKGWDLLEEGTCLDYAAAVAGEESVNAAMDFIMVAQAWLMIKPLNMSMATKGKLGILFAAGALAGIAGIVKIFETYRTIGGAINYWTGFWAIIQMVCSIFCCCVITYKPILPKGAFFGRVADRIKQSLSFISLTNKTKSSQSSSSVQDQPSHQHPPTIGSASWLKLSERDRGIQMTSIWAETKVDSEEDGDGGSRDGVLPPLQQPNTIGVQKRFEVV